MDWNKRARGLGGKYTSGGEENILELPSDRYVGESIFIHEFAHTLDQFGFSRTDPTFRSELRAAYAKAMEEGLWKNTYAATNRAEYWAEGVQSYFDCNRTASPPNGIHNEICDREGLKSYDPRLFALIDRSFGHVEWRYEGKYRSTKRSASMPRG
jgi:alpha-glucosidase